MIHVLFTILSAAIILSSQIWLSIVLFSVITCPRFANPDAKPRRFCTACQGIHWPWNYPSIK